MIISDSFGELARKCDPAARVVSVLPLRRAIRLDRGLDDLSLRAPHERCWRVSRTQLLIQITLGELGISASDSASEFLLIADPVGIEDPESAGRQLWRTLFHAAVDRAFDEAMKQRTPENIRFWKTNLGPALWGEITEVLTGQNLIGEREPDVVILREFVAFLAELTQFEPRHIADYFPGMRPEDNPLDSLGREVDFAALFEQMRPEGVTLMPAHPPASKPKAESPLGDQAVPEAVKAQASGNDVLAAILCRRSGSSMAFARIDTLALRLQQTIRATIEPAPMNSLLEFASEGGWPVERRALYELQRACLDFEKLSYAVSVAETILSLGRRPLKRPLTKTRNLSALLHLRKALRLVEVSRLDEPTKHALVGQITTAIHDTEVRAREELRPEISTTLDDVGLIPRSRAERFNRDKTVEELLDVACARGFLRIGDLRDAIARSRVKLDNLAGPGEFLKGDALLRANAILPERLDGVYKRGEIYMRGLQRGCSLFFGTIPGQLFTLYLALPFGGAFLFLEALHHMVEAAVGFWHWFSGWSATTKGIGLIGGGPSMMLAENPTLEHGGISLMRVGLVGVLFFLLMHWGAFRWQVVHAVKFLLVKLPRAVAKSEVVRWMYRNPVLRAVRRYLLIPLATGIVGYLLARLNGGDEIAWYVGAGVAGVTFFALRTAFGRGIEDQFNEAVGRVWKVVSVNFVLGALAWILYLFRLFVEAIEGAIYTVDEWLRFREGDSPVSFAFKLLFGVVWGTFTYLFRFMWNLLVEPQINPIKHFPVVTVSHKLLLPLIPSLAKQFAMSEKTVGTIVFGIPGIFGFLVWELKENWKLYRRNAAKTIRPAVVGSHGESYRMLMRPGFHSGVVPKTYGKLRRSLDFGKLVKAEKARHHLHHCAEALDRLAERDVVHVLHHSRRWAGLGIMAKPVVLSTNRTRFPFEIEGLEAVVIVSLEQRGGWIIGSLEGSSLAALTASQQAAFLDVVAGLYKLAGVHVLREQTAAKLGEEARTFDAVPEGLLISQAGKTVLYDYNDGLELISPEKRLDSATLLFSEAPLDWEQWQSHWDAEPDRELMPGWRLAT